MQNNHHENKNNLHNGLTRPDHIAKLRTSVQHTGQGVNLMLLSMEKFLHPQFSHTQNEDTSIFTDKNCYIVWNQKKNCLPLIKSQIGTYKISAVSSDLHVIS